MIEMAVLALLVILALTATVFWVAIIALLVWAFLRSGGGGGGDPAIDAWAEECRDRQRQRGPFGF